MSCLNDSDVSLIHTTFLTHVTNSNGTDKKKNPKKQQQVIHSGKYWLGTIPNQLNKCKNTIYSIILQRCKSAALKFVFF